MFVRLITSDDCGKTHKCIKCGSFKYGVRFDYAYSRCICGGITYAVRLNLCKETVERCSSIIAKQNPVEEAQPLQFGNHG